MKSVENIKAKTITGIPFYSEGPVADTDGNIFFTAPPGGLIFKMDKHGHISAWARSVWPNGQVILDNGDHLICDSKLGVVRRFNKWGSWVAEETYIFCGNEKVSTPNDLAVHADGRIYFTDSIRHNGKIWLKKFTGDQEIIASGLDYPNGIVICPKFECLYVAESYKNRILKINIEPPHDISVFALLPEHISKRKEQNLPDGLALDEDGNLWVAHYGMESVHVLSPGGKVLQTINTGIPLTSNVFMMGKDKVIVTGGYGEPGPGLLAVFQL